MNREVALWFEAAGVDLRAAAVLLGEGIFPLVCFHAQQAVEKALKGLLVERSGTHPKGHSLEQLLLMPEVSDEERGRWRAESRRLDEYYLPTRYPDAMPPGAAGGPAREHAETALADATRIVQEIRARTGSGR